MGNRKRRIGASSRAYRGKQKDNRTVEGLAGNEESAGRTESDDAFEKLEKLAKLKDSGVITEEEFNAKKAELLERI